MSDRDDLLNAVADAPKEDLLEILAIVVARCVKEAVGGREFRRVFVGAMKGGVELSRAAFQRAEDQSDQLASRTPAKTRDESD